MSEEEINELFDEITKETEQEENLSLKEIPYAVVMFTDNGIKVKLNKWKHFRPRTAELCKRKIILERDRIKKGIIKGNIPEED